MFKPVPPYESLEEEGVIRLFVLQPGSGDDPIKGSLIHNRLSDGRKYEAISYVWGLEAASKIIGIDGRDRVIRENLWRALKGLRYPDRLRYLWVDAICIDQTNTEERNHQVRQMKSIYQTAERVCVWLGWENQDCITTFNKLKKNAKHFQFLSVRGKDAFWKG